jgi:hypothetical protein
MLLTAARILYGQRDRLAGSIKVSRFDGLHRLRRRDNNNNIKKLLDQWDEWLIFFLFAFSFFPQIRHLAFVPACRGSSPHDLGVCFQNNMLSFLSRSLAEEPKA